MRRAIFQSTLVVDYDEEEETPEEALTSYLADTDIRPSFVQRAIFDDESDAGNAMASDAIRDLAALGNQAAMALEQVNRLCSSDLNAQGVKGLAVAVLEAHDALSAVSDMVDRDLGVLVRGALARGEQL